MAFDLSEVAFTLSEVTGVRKALSSNTQTPYLVTTNTPIIPPEMG